MNAYEPISTDFIAASAASVSSVLEQDRPVTKNLTRLTGAFKSAVERFMVDTGILYGLRCITGIRGIHFDYTSIIPNTLLYVP